MQCKLFIDVYCMHRPFLPPLLQTLLHTLTLTCTHTHTHYTPHPTAGWDMVFQIHRQLLLWWCADIFSSASSLRLNVTPTPTTTTDFFADYTENPFQFLLGTSVSLATCLVTLILTLTCQSRGIPPDWGSAYQVDIVPAILTSECLHACVCTLAYVLQCNTVYVPEYFYISWCKLSLFCLAVPLTDWRGYKTLSFHLASTIINTQLSQHEVHHMNTR